MSHLTGLSSEYTANESLALSQAVSEYYPGIGSCIMIGAQNTLYMEPEDGKEPKIAEIPMFCRNRLIFRGAGR